MNDIIKKAAKIIIPAIAIPAAINALIFRIAEFSDKKEFEKDVRIKESFFEWRHAKARYIEAGSGKPLLLIHNMEVGGSLYEWQEVIHRLSEHYHVYAVDLPGFGYSEKRLMTYSVYFYVTFVNDFIREIIGERTMIVAAGASSAIAIFAAEMAEENVSRILLVSPSGILENNMPTNRDVWYKWLLNAPLVGTSVHNFLSSKIFIKWYLKKGLKLKETAIRKNVRRRYFPAHAGGSAAKSSTISLITRFLNVAIEHKLCNPVVPIQIICCKGFSVDLDYMFDIIKKSRNLSISIFEKSYVAPQLETPDKFVRCCINFFS